MAAQNSGFTSTYTVRANRSSRRSAVALRTAAAFPLEQLESRVFLSAAAPSFQPASKVPLSGNATAIVTDDFNQDGNEDVAVALGANNAIAVAFGNGDGTFGSFTTFPTGADPTAIAVGDFNNDGNDDIVTADAGSGDISVLLANTDSNANATGTFASPMNVHVEPPGGAMSLAVGDFNGDGNLDVAAAGPHGLYVLLGNGDGTFAHPHLVANGNFSGVVADSFFPAGNTDLAAVDPATGVVDVFAGNGDGTFAAPDNYNVGIGASSIASGDFNGDGVEDLAVTVPGENAVKVLLGNTTTVTEPLTPITPTPVPGPTQPVGAPSNISSVGSGSAGSSGGSIGGYSYTTGTGTFASPSTIQLDQTPTTLTLDALSGDGHLDIVTTNTANNTVTVIPGNGDGTFAAPVDLAAGAAPATVVTDDMNNDGGDDIVTAGAGNVSVLLQQSSDVGVTLATSSPSPTINADFTYTATVTNSGPGTATGVTLDDSLPSNVTLVSATSSQGSVDTSGNPVAEPVVAPGTDVTASLGNLASGASATVTIVVKPTQYGAVSDSVSVSSDSNDPNYSNNYASSDTHVVGASGAEVVLTSANSGGGILPPVPLPLAGGVKGAKTTATTVAPLLPWGGWFARVGEDYTYNFTVSNYGPDKAAALTFTDTLPSGVKFESTTASQGATDSSTPGTVTAALGDLAAGASATVSITVKPTVAGEMTSNATVAAADPSSDPYAADNSVTVNTYVLGNGVPVPLPVATPVSTLAGGASGKTITTGVPTLSIANVKKVVGARGTTDFVFTVTRRGNLTNSSTVSYSTLGASAKPGADFKPASGQIAFAAGVSSATVTVPVIGSRRHKPDATFVVALKHATNATVKTARAVGTIISAGKAPKPAPNPFAKGVNINFEPAGGPTVKGYLRDTGLGYSAQGASTFGWSSDNTANAVDRNTPKDARYNTFNVLGAPGASNWQIAVPNGRYSVKLVAGDPTNTTNSYSVDANGELLQHGAAHKKHPFVTGNAVIRVTNGTLALTPGSDTPDDLDFVKIKYVGI